jgi:hypothetical protein
MKKFALVKEEKPTNEVYYFIEVNGLYLFGSITRNLDEAKIMFEFLTSSKDEPKRTIIEEITKEI